MDLISNLSSALNIDNTKAQALAGGVLGQVTDQLKSDGEPAAADELAGAVPELGGWAKQASGLLGEGGAGSLLGGGGLMGAAAGMLGGDAGKAAGLMAMVSKLGLNADSLAKAAPVVLQFLGTRVSPELLSKVQGLIPGLGGGESGESGESGGIGGMLGGLLG